MSYAIYQERILDHSRNPRNFGELDPADVVAKGDNPLCGDDVTLFFRFNGDEAITDVRFQGRGCAISQASASMLTERIIGMPPQEAARIGEEDILEMLGVPVTGSRTKCAFLSLETLKSGLGKRGPSEHG